MFINAIFNSFRLLMVVSYYLLLEKRIRKRNRLEIVEQTTDLARPQLFQGRYYKTNSLFCKGFKRLSGPTTKESTKETCFLLAAGLTCLSILCMMTTSPVLQDLLQRKNIHIKLLNAFSYLSYGNFQYSLSKRTKIREKYIQYVFIKDENTRNTQF